MILSSLAEEIDPTTTCTFLGLCTSHVEEQPVTNGLECEVCEWVVGVLQNYITKNTTEAEIVVILQKVCSLVPQSMKAVVCFSALRTLCSYRAVPSLCGDICPTYHPEVIGWYLSNYLVCTVASVHELCRFWFDCL